MISLDTRSRDILIYLLENIDRISIKQIAETNQLSVDNVNYSLQRIEVWLDLRGKKINKSHDKKVIIVVTEYERHFLLNELRNLSGYSLILSANERQQYISLILLTEKQPMLSKSIAYDLRVSRPTILSDIDRVEEWLNDFNIRLIRKPGTGFLVDGHERDIRNAIEVVLHITLDNVTLLSLCHGQNKSVLSHYPEQGIIKLPIPFALSVDKLMFSGKIIRNIEKQKELNFSDNTYFSLVVFLYIVITRNLEKMYLDDSIQDNVSMENSNEYLIAIKVSAEINQEFDITLQESEIKSIAIRLLGAKPRQSEISSSKQGGALRSDELYESVIIEMISEASKLLHPILAVDQKLMKGLLIHLKPAINRLLYKVPIQNKLLPEIKKRYPYIFSVAKISVQVIEEKYHLVVSDEEVGFIAMHLGAAMERLSMTASEEIRALVVCGGGCATAYLLMSRINAEFPEFNIVEVCSILELTEEKIFSLNLDLIISTIPLGNLSTPTILVSPLLNDNDKKIISNYLSSRHEKSDSPNMNASTQENLILKLLSNESVQTNVSVIDWYDAVNKACLPLLINNSISRKYIIGIKDLLEKHGPYMVIGQHIVLLHAMVGYGVNKLCLSLTTFSPPVVFGHKYNDPVSLAFVFGTVDGESHFQLLSQLSQLLGDQELIQLLIQQKSAEDILQVIKKSLN